jgi:hypothetical protein
LKKVFENEDDKKISEIKRELESDDVRQLQAAERVVFKKDLDYREKKGRKWIWMLVGIFVFCLLGWIGLPLITKLTNSLYDRTGLEEVTI